TYDMTGRDMGHSEVPVWYMANVVSNGNLAVNMKPPEFVAPSDSTTSDLLSGDAVSSLTTASLQALLSAYSTVSALVATDTDLQTVVSAVNGLHSQQGDAVVAVILGDGYFSDITPRPP